MVARTLIVTVGLPRAGKSHWARRQGIPVINPDSIRLAIHGKPFYHPAEGFVWATADTMVRALFYAGHPTLILDATNVSYRRRERWVPRNGEWQVYFKVFEIPLEECLKRAESDATLCGIIKKMASEWEPLRAHERTLESLQGCSQETQDPSPGQPQQPQESPPLDAQAAEETKLVTDPL